jgi:beta-phosphoglucomutase-like phosphatase (HAD superfamily)
VTDAVVFDLDGVLLDNERVWDEVREQLVRDRGAHWHERAPREMMGMSSVEEEPSLARAHGIPMLASLSARCERSS